ncbi:site-specific integrase [Ulvibacterium sp.]|uniref:tyrosine-type recombinase/integrase n=1 Tax=Ulvibacterium sp. TaxID=2665914 RepID=UPI0026068140|nr:site-specific integrase [Ulvibacterium sp.]
MAKISLILDTRESSRKNDGTYPISLRVHHIKTRCVSLGHSTSILGWDEVNNKLRKSVAHNKGLRREEINIELEDKLYQARCLLRELGDGLLLLDVKALVRLIKDRWNDNIRSEIKKKVENDLSLEDWGNILIQRKRNANKPGTAKWYYNGMVALKKFNEGKIAKLHEIDVSFLRNFEAYHLGKGNSKNTISIYLRAIRAIYNSAIEEDRFVPLRNPFETYKIPSGGRTRKRARTKENINSIKGLVYPAGSVLWHARNYAMIMFYCRGMNFIDLVQVKVGHVTDTHIYYGRSKSDKPLAIKIVPELRKILEHYMLGKRPKDYLFPTNYDGSSEHYQKYKSQRRRMNERLRIIAKDAGIEGKFTTYNIRHSWATIAKYLGVSTELISEALGHSSLRTTQVYLKDFDNDILDEVNTLVVS